MARTSDFNSVPADVLLNVAIFLRPNELASLVRTSKLFTGLQFLVWRSIELHPPRFHGELSSHSSNLRFLVDSQSPEPKALQNYERMRKKTKIFFLTLKNLRLSNPTRWQLLAGSVRHLCFTAKHSNAIEAIPDFFNLERLHIVTNFFGSYEKLHKGAQADYPSLPTGLRDVRLRGYFPKRFIRELLRASPHIERLDLGLLDSIEGRLITVADMIEIGESGELHTNRDEMEVLAPRSLLWMSKPWEPNFGSVTSLCLTKPKDADPLPDHMDLDFDDGLDRLVLLEWARILRLVQSSVVSLKFDLLELAGDVILDGDPGASAIPGASPGDERFWDYILPVLLELEWPSLRQLELRGIHLDFCCPADMADQLRKKLAGVEIKCIPGTWMIVYHYDEGYIHRSYTEDGIGYGPDGLDEESWIEYDSD